MSLTPRLIETNEICESRFQPRSRYSNENINALAADIAEHGIMQPPWVRPIKGKAPVKFELIFGHRRWKAAVQAGYAQIPAVVREVDDLESRRLAVIENLDNESLSDWDEARAVNDLWLAFNEAEGAEISQTELCRRLGRAPQWLINRRRVLDLPADLAPIAAAHSGVMTQLFDIAATKGELRKRLIAGFDTEGKRRLSVKAVRAIIAEEHERAGVVLASYTPPDTHSQRRQTQARGHGTAPQSRGVTVTGSTVREATDSAAAAARAMLYSLDTAERWLAAGGKVPRAELLQVQRRVSVLLGGE